ncbi:MAG: hypothetical protein ACXVR1_01075 [Solirubrobacteraceae bacterium]
MTNDTHSTPTAETAAPTEAESPELQLSRLDDAHLAWFIAETECAQAFQAWRAGTGNDADMAFCSYLAALDREESAARYLERLWNATEACAPTLMRRMEDTVH